MNVEQILSLGPELADFLDEFADCFGRSEPRCHMAEKALGLLPRDPGCAQRLRGFLFAVAAPFRAQRVRTEEARIVGWLCRRLVTEVDRQPDASQRRVIVERTVHCEAAKDHHVSWLKVRSQQTGLT